MFTKLCIVKVMVIILIMLHYGSCMSIKRKLVAPFKPANCFLPENCTHCKNVLPNSGFKTEVWFFSESYKSCFPHTFNSNQKNCCNYLNFLPKTQKECEDMCGEPCIVTHANFKTEPGICMHDCYINAPPGVPATCKIDNGFTGFNCCPRGYQAPSFLREEAYRRFHNIMNSIVNKTVSSG